ncbi:hypothetical protein NQZ68_035926 [Dissostichus eleginoides]|nr:hypothetical protein NQZ68_035926 [Dissostichus eleginoides]
MRKQREQGESLFLLNSLTVVLSALPPALPQSQVAVCINNAGDSTRGNGSDKQTAISLATSTTASIARTTIAEHTLGGIPLPRWPDSPPAAVTQRGPPVLLLLDQRKAKSAARRRQRMRRRESRLISTLR